MKISSNFNTSVSFQKRLRASCTVLKDNKPEKCGIYQLEADKDEDYFSKIKYTPDWMNSNYADMMDMFIDENMMNIDEIHVMEDKKGNCIGFYQLYSDDLYDDENDLSINFIEAVSAKNKNKNYKYIGETLLSYAALKAKKENKNLKVCSAVRSAQDFYTKYGFMLVKNSQLYNMDGYLAPEKFDNLISKNQNHTKDRIKVIV